MACGERTTPLHLKMVINHEKFAARGESVCIDWCDYKLVLVPRQNLLKKLDPDGTRSVAEMREQLRPMANAYERLVLHDIRAPGLDIREALKIYRNFHLIRYMPAWVENDIPLACTCKICVNHCVCDDTLLFAALFKPEVRVPSDYVAATVNLRKRCKSLKGAVGRKRMRILEEQKCNEKVIDSKVKIHARDSPGAAGARVRCQGRERRAQRAITGRTVIRGRRLRQGIFPLLVVMNGHLH